MKKLTRAKFLQLLLSTATLSTLSLTSCQNQKIRSQNNPRDSSEEIETDVIIIGAGIAGIIAGNELIKQGVKVLVLEGRERIGGRIWTDTRWNTPIDLGAGWIHGSQGNPLVKLAQDFQVSTVDFDFDDSVVYTANGEEFSNEEVEYYEELFEEFLNSINDLRSQRDDENKQDISLQQVIDKILEDEDLDQEEIEILNFLLNTSIEHEYAASLKDLSLYYWDQGEGFGDDNLILPQGYNQLLNPLAKDLDIKLNQIVEKIEWNQNIKITTNQGIFKSKYAIITLPLGVLKSGKVEFSPSLPDEKQEAIQRLGMGVLNKVLLKFPQVFWDDTQAFNYISSNSGEWGEWINLDAIVKQPILLGFNAADFGIKLEQYSDGEIIKKGMEVLKTIYGNIPEPIDSIITRWHQDPFSYGSYSSLKLGATPDDYDKLAQPVTNKLFFAGEATEKNYSATVHGALLSGKRAAKQVFSKLSI
jgi:monoamine oxidase